MLAKLRAALLAVGGTLIACSSAPASPPSLDGGFPAAAFATIDTQEGKLRIEVRSAPEQPPTRGTSTIEFSIVDASSGKPVDDLTLGVVPWMPVMAHGTSLTPIVSPSGQGKYTVSNVNLFMPGQWELRTLISGKVADRAAPSFQVP